MDFFDWITQIAGSRDTEIFAELFGCSMFEKFDMFGDKESEAVKDISDLNRRIFHIFP